MTALQGILTAGRACPALCAHSTPSLSAHFGVWPLCVAVLLPCPLLCGPLRCHGASAPQKVKLMLCDIALPAHHTPQTAPAEAAPCFPARKLPAPDTSVSLQRAFPAVEGFREAAEISLSQLSLPALFPQSRVTNTAAGRVTG